MASSRRKQLRAQRFAEMRENAPPAQTSQDPAPAEVESEALDGILLEVVDRNHGGDIRPSYEEANWAKLSPAFRNAHNRLRKLRGLAPIPEPKIDLYVPPRGPTTKPFDFSNPDFIASARQFMGGGMMIPGSEGFVGPDKAMKILRGK